MELTLVVDELFRKIGRNLYIIQQIERLLKTLLAFSSVSGPTNASYDPQERQVERYALQTLGGLVSQYLCMIDPVKKYREVELVRVSSGLYSVQFFTKLDQITFERKKVTLTQMVSLRNALTHHLLDQVDLASLESCIAFGRQLDMQREKFVEEFNDLKAQTLSLLKARTSAAELLKSDTLHGALNDVV